MKQGSDAVAGVLASQLPLNDPCATLRCLASTVGQAMGGTSGAIYRILFTAASGETHLSPPSSYRAMLFFLIDLIGSLPCQSRPG